MLKLDEAGRRVSVTQVFKHPTPLVAIAMGSVQILSSGNVLVGFGSVGHFSEFTSTGSLLSDGRLVSGWQSYRVLLLPWRGSPHRPPDLAVRQSVHTGHTIVYASWNGDTQTAYWRVHVGHSQSDMRPIGTARRLAFETAIPVGNAHGYFAVTALDETGRPLGHSAAIRL